MNRNLGLFAATAITISFAGGASDAADGLVGYWKLTADARDSSGPNQVAWDGRDDNNTTVRPGLYLIRLEANTDAGDATQMRSVAVVY